MSENCSRRQELEQLHRYWSAHIGSWQESGLSQAEYCQRHELKYHRFVYWRKMFAPKPVSPVSIFQVPPAAVELAAGCEGFPSALRVSLGSDLCIDVFPGFDAPTLQQVVVALREVR